MKKQVITITFLATVTITKAQTNLSGNNDERRENLNKWKQK